MGERIKKKYKTKRYRDTMGEYGEISENQKACSSDRKTESVFSA